MERNQFSRFSDGLLRLGEGGVGTSEFRIGANGRYELQYTPFEHINRDARLVIVGITPGNTQLSLAYKTAQKLLRAGRPVGEIFSEIKKAGSFGGSAIKPNLLKLLRHLQLRGYWESGMSSLFGGQTPSSYTQRQSFHMLHSKPKRCFPAALTR